MICSFLNSGHDLVSSSLEMVTKATDAVCGHRLLFDKAGVLSEKTSVARQVMLLCLLIVTTECIAMLVLLLDWRTVVFLPAQHLTIHLIHPHLPLIPFLELSLNDHQQNPKLTYFETNWHFTLLWGLLLGSSIFGSVVSYSATILLCVS